MKEIYRNFKLLGYKITEFSSGYFKTKWPNGKVSLFDSQGKLIKGTHSKII